MAHDARADFLLQSAQAGKSTFDILIHVSGNP